MSDETTLRNELDGVGFDWETGKIIIQKTRTGGPPGWEGPTSASVISVKAKVLTKKFDAGYGGPECPRFVAEDKDAIYFPVQYDGATWVERIFKDITKYLDIKNPTPYPGG